MKKIKHTDTELLDYLDRKTKEGFCLGLINDDFGHWAVSDYGMQNVPAKAPASIMTSFFVERRGWTGSVREALEKYINEKEREEKKNG